MIGEKFHHYIITRLIGEGGMASVYEAVHEKLQTKVAIKVLNPILTANRNIRQRFENEARFMAGLRHPNITRVIDYEERPDLLAIILEFLEGEDLNVRIKRNGPLPLPEALAYFTQVLDAFEYAHNKAIVHRDVKPSNIFIEPSNEVKILDFGIAKLVGAADDMTMTGTQMGTPVYMSPEQVNTDKTIDHRSDIYSLGVTLYYMLKGEPPYDTNTTSSFQIYTKIVQEPLPALAKYPEIDKILRIATHKDRAQRYQSCKEFRQALIEAAQQKKPAPDTDKHATPVDSDKTLIDIPEPVKKEPLPVAAQKEKKKPVEIKKPAEKKEPVEKKERITSTSTGSRKIRTVIFSSLGLLGLVIIVLTKVYPSWFTQIFNPAEMERRAEFNRTRAIQWLDLGKAQFKKEFDPYYYDSAVYYLNRAAKIDPDNLEIQYFLADALFRSGLRDSTDIPNLNFKAIARSSDIFEDIIRINPAYTDTLRSQDPYVKLTALWGKLALKYLVNYQNDSAMIAFNEGRKRGAFNDVNLEIARNSLNSCDEDAIVFMLWDCAYYPVLYVQEIEKLRTDVRPIIIDFLEDKWYFNYYTQNMAVPVSFGETWFGLMDAKDWETQIMTVDNVNTGQTFAWWLSGDASGKLSKRDQIILDIITTNKFSKPIHYSIFFNMNKNTLGLNQFFHPEGLVYKLRPEAFKGRGKVQESKLDNLSYEAVQNTSIPSINLRAMLDFIRNEYLQLINAYYSEGDREDASNATVFYQLSIPETNYPVIYKEIDAKAQSINTKWVLTDEERHQKEHANIQEYAVKNNLYATPTASGLCYIEETAGSGPRAMPGNTVKIHYTGTYLNGTKFDSSYDRGVPYQFELGAGNVIKGLDEGVALMNVGGKGLLIIPYDLAYGPYESSVPAYSTLVFEVELLEIE